MEGEWQVGLQGEGIGGRAVVEGLGPPAAGGQEVLEGGRGGKGWASGPDPIASGVGLTNAWLADQGLLSMKTLWAQLAPLRRTA